MNRKCGGARKMEKVRGSVEGKENVKTESHLARFSVQKFLGKGSYGSVFRVKKISSGNVYALKETNVRKMSQDERADAVNEIRLLASCQHPNVVTYNEAFIEGNRLCIVMEYAACGDLTRAIRRRASQCRPFPEDLVWSYFIQIARALQSLHQSRILHRDVKSGNVLRIDNRTVKLGDLGIAKLMKNNMTSTQIGTPHYMPPEVWRNRPYSFSSDIWSLGCLLYEICTFNVPFPARDMRELRHKVLRNKVASIPRMYSSDLSSMIRVLMQVNAKDRPSAADILNFDVVQRRTYLAPDISDGEKPNLLQTIKVPKNFRLISKRLPKPFYPDESGPPMDTACSWPLREREVLPSVDVRTSVSSPGARIQQQVVSTSPPPIEPPSRQNLRPSKSVYDINGRKVPVAESRRSMPVPPSRNIRASYGGHYNGWSDEASISAAGAAAVARAGAAAHHHGIISKHKFSELEQPTPRIRLPKVHGGGHRGKRISALPPIPQGEVCPRDRYYR